MAEEYNEYASNISNVGNIGGKVDRAKRKALDIKPSEAGTRVSDVQGVIKNMNKVLNNLSQFVKSTGSVLKTNAKDITATAKESAKQYSRSVKEDVRVDKQNLVATTLSSATPIFGYFASKFMETDVWQKFASTVKDKLSNAVKQGLQKAKDFSKTLLTPIVEKVRGMFGKVSEIFGSIGSGVRSLIPGMGGGGERTEIPKLAKGGYIGDTGLAKIHPAEVVAPSEQILKEMRKSAVNSAKREEGIIERLSNNFRNFANIQREQKEQTTQQLRILREQLPQAKEESTVKKFFRDFKQSYQGTIEENLDVQNRTYRAVNQIRNTLVTPVGGILESLKYAFNNFLFQHPVFRNLLMMSRAIISPVWRIPGAILRIRGNYQAQMRGVRGTPMERTAKILGMLYPPLLHKLDQLILAVRGEEEQKSGWRIAGLPIRAVKKLIGESDRSRERREETRRVSARKRFEPIPSMLETLDRKLQPVSTFFEAVTPWEILGVGGTGGLIGSIESIENQLASPLSVTRRRLNKIAESTENAASKAKHLGDIETYSARTARYTQGTEEATQDVKSRLGLQSILRFAGMITGAIGSAASTIVGSLGSIASLLGAGGVGASLLRLSKKAKTTVAKSGEEATKRTATRAGGRSLLRMGGRTLAKAGGAVLGGATGAYFEGKGAAEEGRTKKQVAGAAAGGGSGALAGAATGAALTSWVPIPGARLAGAAIGGLAGSKLGSYIGQSVAQEFASGRTGKEAQDVAEKINKQAVEKTRDIAAKKGVIDIDWFGNDNIRDWSTVQRLNPGQIKSLIEKGDWDKNTLERLRQLAKGKQLGETVNIKDMLPSMGVKRLSEIGAIDRVGWWGASKINDWQTIKSLKPGEVKKVIQYDDWTNKTLDRLKKIYNEKTNKALNVDVEKSARDTVMRLAEKDIVSYVGWGSSRIKDMEAVKNLKPGQIKRLIEFDDWNDQQLSKLKKIYKEKTEMGVTDTLDKADLDQNKVAALKNMGVNLSDKELRKVVDKLSQSTDGIKQALADTSKNNNALIQNVMNTVQSNQSSTTQQNNGGGGGNRGGTDETIYRIFNGDIN